MKFRFEPLLKLRKHQEDNCTYRLKQEKLTLLEINEELEKIKQKSAEEEEFLETAALGRIDPFLLSTGSGYISYLRRIHRQVDGRRVAQEKQVDEARSALLEARKEKKAMEKAKEGFLAREKSQTLTREQKLLDEMGINLVHLGKR